MDGPFFMKSILLHIIDRQIFLMECKHDSRTLNLLPRSTRTCGVEVSFTDRIVGGKFRRKNTYFLGYTFNMVCIVILCVIQFQQLERHSHIDNIDKLIVYYYNSYNTNLDSFHNQTLSDVDELDRVVTGTINSQSEIYRRQQMNVSDYEALARYIRERLGINI